MKKTEIVDVDPSKFYTLTPSQRRVAIAKDVLKQLSFENIIPRSVYCEVMDNVFDIGDLRTQLAKKQCHACALGSLFFSHVILSDRVTISRERVNFRRDEIVLKLSQEFDEQQLNLIECAFEGNYFIAMQIPKKYIEKTMSFYEKNRPQGKKYILEKICENIIENNGTFIP